MTTDKTDNEDKLLYRDLTYKIIGALFKVQNLLGNSLEERYYQRALASEFEELGLKFQQECPVDITFNSKVIGKHKIDFLIENKIILETKTIPQITSKSATQLLSYLKSTQVRIGILANFRTDKLTYRRLVNPLIR